MQSPASSPERRSDADLQRILDSLIGESGYVLSVNLPDGSCNPCSYIIGGDCARGDERLTDVVLIQYEEDHDLIILEASEYDGLRTLCAQHDNLELGPKELFSFLT